MKNKIKINCEFCNKEFSTRDVRRKYCSRKCFKVDVKAKKREYNQRPDVKAKQRERLKKRNESFKLLSEEDQLELMRIKSQEILNKIEVVR